MIRSAPLPSPDHRRIEISVPYGGSEPKDYLIQRRAEVSLPSVPAFHERIAYNRKSHPAEHVENVVYGALRDMVDDQDLLTQKITERFAEKRRELSRAASDATPLVERLAYLDRRKEGYWDLAADGDISKEAMRRKVADLDAEREALQRSVDDARHRDERLEALDRREQHLLSLVSGGPDKYAHIERTFHAEDGSHHEIVSLYRTLMESVWTPEQRRELYQGLGLRVEVGTDGRISIDGTLPDGPGDGGAEVGVASETLSRMSRPPAIRCKRSSVDTLLHAWNTS